MVTSKAGLDLIKEFEGCVLTAYKCPAGVWTIGYGHTAGVKQGMKITKTQANQFLKQDVKNYEKAVESYNDIYKWTQSEFDALVSFTYNCGAGNLRTLLNNGKRTKKQISDALLLYNKAGGQTLAGLVRRRKAEQKLFNSQSTLTTNEGGYMLPTIQNGSTGQAVAVWQVILGFTGDDVDGVFGKDTEKATLKFQQKAFPENNKEWDCIVGQKTWTAGLNSIK